MTHSPWTALSIAIAAAAIAFGVAACGATDPYVFKRDEFDRQAEDFNKPPTDRSQVTICYNGVGTPDKRIEEMAQEECGKFGKIARVQGETFGLCPLMVPVEADFACILADSTSGGAPPAPPPPLTGP